MRTGFKPSARKAKNGDKMACLSTTSRDPQQGQCLMKLIDRSVMESILKGVQEAASQGERLITVRPRACSN
jgi:hypothetical protein